MGVTKLVCDINVIKLDPAAILKNICCYGNGCQAQVMKGLRYVAYQIKAILVF